MILTIDNVTKGFQQSGVTVEQDDEVLISLVQAIPYEDLLIDNLTNTYLHQAETQMKYESMQKLHPDKARQALYEEMTTLVSKNAIKGEKRSETNAHKIQYVMSRYVEKFKEGTLDRVRGKTVLEEKRMVDEYADKWDSISSRTISLTSDCNYGISTNGVGILYITT